MKNLKIRYKMYLGFGSILILLIVMNGFSLYNIRKTGNMVPKLYEGPHMNALSSVALVKEMYQMDASLKSMLLENSTEHDRSYYESARNAATRELEAVTAIGTLSPDKLSQLKNAIASLDSAYAEIIKLVSVSQEQAYEKLEQSFKPAMDTAIAVVQDLAVSANQEAEQFRDNAVKGTTWIIIVQDIMFAVIVIASMYIAIKMGRDISLPIRKLAKEMEKISRGDFNVELNNASKDEIGMLSRQLRETVDRIKTYIQDISYILGEISHGNIALEVNREYVGDFGAIKVSLNHIIDALNNTMEQIDSCCEQVQAGSANLASNSQALAQGSAEQSAAVESFQTSLNTVAELTAGDGENAARVKDLSLRTSDAVQFSNNQMQKMVVAMDDINASSQEIAKIIKIIEDIAFQTNILALNAAVEAARAGAAGKGFAVVADEVRNLASKSAEASKNTAQLIQNSMGAVENGTKIADTAATSFKEVDDNVRQMAVHLEEIDKSTNRQAEAFGQMVEMSDKITTVVITNSSAAEENSAASEELSQQANLLEHLVDKFKLKNKM